MKKIKIYHIRNDFESSFGSSIGRFFAGIVKWVIVVSLIIGTLSCIIDVLSNIK